MNTVINALNVSYGYQNNKVLKDISFGLEQGSFTALIGPNGAGKTTLFSLMSQFMSPQTGEIQFHFDGKRVSGREALKSIGFVFQQTTLDPDLTVAQNLHYHASLHGLNRRLANQRIKSELARMGMLDRASEKIRKLNGGHKRRVEIARALLHHPSLLLLDEPTTGLDIETREKVNLYIRSLCADKQITILYTTHLLDEIQDDDYLILLDKGCVSQQGICKKLMENNQLDTMRELWLNKSNLNQ